MIVQGKLGFAWRALILVMALAPSPGCRDRANDTRPNDPGEPEDYSATVVRIVENGGNSETVITHEARAGELRREDWTENGNNRALIWRPDTGKAFLLDLDRRVYVQIDISSTPLPEPRARDVDQPLSNRRSPDAEATDQTVQAIDRYFGDAQLPTRVETQALAPATIDGHSCDVDQQRAIFPDGHTETTTKFYARDLSGLLLRVESVGEHGATRVITERRDVRTGVAPDTFTVPADYKRVEMLQR